MVSDLLSDLVSRIKNGYLVGSDSVEVAWSKAGEETIKVLSECGYVGKFSKNGRFMSVDLKYEGKNPVLTNIERLSRPGARNYVGYRDIPRVWGGIGINIISTPKGIMADKQAKKMKLGGELICRVW
jgi:small subunit ribosomal protein S8